MSLTKKSSGLLKDWWSICLSCFYSCFNAWKATSVYSGYFQAICRLYSFHIDISYLGEVKLEILLHDYPIRFRYSTGCVFFHKIFLLTDWVIPIIAPMKLKYICHDGLAL